MPPQGANAETAQDPENEDFFVPWVMWRTDYEYNLLSAKSNAEGSAGPMFRVPNSSSSPRFSDPQYRL